MTAAPQRKEPKKASHRRPSGLRYRKRNVLPVLVAAPEYIERPCMCCGRLFKADGKFNRLCQPCKDSDRSSLL
jgi:hypothetical protein